MPRPFQELRSEVERCLDPDEPSKIGDVQTALEALEFAYPLPPTELVEKDVWDTAGAYLRINIHYTAKRSDAINNIRYAGHAFTSAADNHWLTLVLSHWCRWSATKPRHRHDGWVKYVQTLYSHLDGLVPILDTVAYPEDLVHYPHGLGPPEPSLFLFATSQCYYVFDLEEMGLCKAGESLEEVYMGLKGFKYQMYEGGWDVEPWSSTGGGVNDRNVFPIYERYDEEEFRELEEVRASPVMSFHGSDGRVFVLSYPIKDFEAYDVHQKLDDLMLL
jgi:hypothetical protein